MKDLNIGELIVFNPATGHAETFGAIKDACEYANGLANTTGKTYVLEVKAIYAEPL